MNSCDWLLDDAPHQLENGGELLHLKIFQRYLISWESLWSTTITWVASPPSSRIMLGCHDSAEMVFSMHHLTKKDIKRRTRKFKLLPEVFLALASPCENRDTSLCQSRRHLVLGGVDVARGPPHLDGGQSESSQLDLYSMKTCPPGRQGSAESQQAPRSERWCACTPRCAPAWGAGPL